MLRMAEVKQRLRSCSMYLLHCCTARGLAMTVTTSTDSTSFSAFFLCHSRTR
uniref:Uncharacterized protein n=1 Tax=Anguilla anguilla TaxID=7936 RepID=A0A0E9XC73_ANGAN